MDRCVHKITGITVTEKRSECLRAAAVWRPVKRRAGQARSRATAVCCRAKYMNGSVDAADKVYKVLHTVSTPRLKLNCDINISEYNKESRKLLGDAASITDNLKIICHDNHHHYQNVLPKGRSFITNAGTKVAVLSRGSSSTANSGTKVGINRCGNFPLLCAPHSLFHIWTDLKWSE